MQTKQKIISVALGLMLTASLLGGCGKGAGSNSLDFSNATLSGTITAVDGDKVTVSMSGGFGGGRMGNRNEERDNSEERSTDNNTDATQATGEESLTPPQMPEGLDGSNLPEMPNGEMPTDMPKGEMPNGDAFKNMFSQGGSTFTLTITDESVLEDCTMDDIAEGSFITITLGDNNTITSITVMKLTNSQSSSKTSEEDNNL